MMSSTMGGEMDEVDDVGDGGMMPGKIWAGDEAVDA